MGRVTDIAWLAGFLSGVSAWSSKDSSGVTDLNGMVAEVDDYCAEHPLVKISFAAQVLSFTKMYPGL
jgi:hypothetical protein